MVSFRLCIYLGGLGWKPAEIKGEVTRLPLMLPVPFRFQFWFYVTFERRCTQEIG